MSNFFKENRLFLILRIIEILGGYASRAIHFLIKGCALPDPPPPLVYIYLGNRQPQNVGIQEISFYAGRGQLRVVILLKLNGVMAF
jgi:hypothetical protein